MSNLARFILLIVVSMVIGCSKEKKDSDKPTIDPPVVEEKRDSGIYVLSNGSFNQEISKVGYYDLVKNQYTEDYFTEQNSTLRLSGSCSGGFQYGSKLYIFLSSNESKILVLNMKDAKFLAEIDAGEPFVSNLWPKRATAHKNLIYIVGDGGFVHVIDTLSLKRVKSFELPQWANDVVIQNDKLFVTNKKSLTLIGFDTSLLAMNMNTGVLEKNINVGWYPRVMIKDGERFIYLQTNGNSYYDDRPALLKIDATSGKIEKRISAQLRGLAIYNDNILAITGHPNDQSNNGKIPVYDRLTLALLKENFVTDGTLLVHPRHIYIDEKLGTVYIVDTKDSNSPGHVYIFNKDGKKLLDFATTNSINPHTLLFKN